MTLTPLASLNDEEFLQEAYRLVLGREIDSSGQANYRNRLAKGRSRASVLVSLAGSREAQDRFAPPALLDLPDEDFVDAAYVRLLGRNADPDGMQHYLKQLQKHGDRLKILHGIGSSQEARKHDPVGWTFRHELDDLIRRETSFLGWRKILPKSGGTTPRSSSSDADFDTFAKEMLQVQREENAALKDQIAILASALEGVSAAQKRDNARIDELAAALDAMGQRD